VLLEVGGGFGGVELEAQRGEVHALVVEAILARGWWARGGRQFGRCARCAARRPSAERKRPVNAGFMARVKACPSGFGVEVGGSVWCEAPAGASRWR